MIVKYDREASTNWVLEERQPGNQLRMYNSTSSITEGLSKIRYVQPGK